MMRRTLALAALALLSACHDELRFVCDDDAQCNRGGLHGACADSPWSAARYCAFHDPACPSGARWDRTAGDGLRSTCLDSAVRDGGGASDGGTGGDGGDGGDVGDSGAPDAAQPVALTWSAENSQAGGNLFGVGGTGPSDVYAVGEPGVLHTTDHGKTWTSQKLPPEAGDIEAVWGSGPDNVYAVGRFGVILHSANAGTTWKSQRVDPNTGDLFAIWGSDPHNLFVVGWDGVILHATDGVTWKTLDAGVTEHLNGVWGSSALDVFAVGNSGTIVHTTDGGKSWKKESAGAATDLESVGGSGSGEVYAVGVASSVALRRNPAGGWDTLTIGPPHGDLIRLWVAAPGSVYITGSGGVLLHTRDGGQSWLSETTHSGAGLNAAWGASPLDVYVVGTSGAILHGVP